jgi:hypothetical protein
MLHIRDDFLPEPVVSHSEFRMPDPDNGKKYSKMFSEISHR